MTLFHRNFHKVDEGAKYTSLFERTKLVVKLLLTMLFYIEVSNWIFAIVVFMVSGYLVYIYYRINPDYSPFLRKVKVIASVLFFWSGIVLVIGVVFSSSLFNGCLPLMFIGGLIASVTIVIHQERDAFILYQNINTLLNAAGVFSRIRSFLNLISEKNYKREPKVILSGYVERFADSSNPHCPLKKYKEAIDKKLSANIYLYQHAEALFQAGISLFPNYVLLRIGYSMALNDFLNKKQSALKEILNAKKYSPTFEEQFIIFKAEHEYTDYNSQHSSSHCKADAFSALAYKNNFKLYKSQLLQIALLYVEFWGLLLNKNEDHLHLEKLYQIGNKITKCIKHINYLFDRLQRVNLNDEEVLFYYVELCNSILNDEELAVKYKKQFDLIQEEKEDDEELSLANINIKALTSNDRFQFILLSNSQDAFVISNISLSVCILLGYTKEELLGKTLDKLIPELLKKEHRKMLQYHLRQYKEESSNKEVQGEESKKKLLKEIAVFALNKARYLVQMHISTAIIPTEAQGYIFIAQVSTMPNGYSSYLNKLENICHILTNNNFIIQNFTVNSMSLLGLKSSVMNGKVELTSFIKQFHEDFLSQVFSNDNLTFEQKMSIKKSIINLKYRSPIVINWKQTDIDSIHQSTNKNIFNIENESLIIDIDKRITEKKQQGMFNEHYFLTISDATIRDKQEGYFFKFELCSSKDVIANMQKRSSNDSSRFSIKRTTMNSPHNTLPQSRYSSPFQSLKQIPLLDLQFDANNPPQESRIDFQINPEGMCFVVNSKPSTNHLDKLRLQALRKIDLYNQQDNPLSNEEETEEVEESSEEDDENHSVIYHLSENLSSPSNKLQEGRGSPSMSMNRTKAAIDETYYKIDFSHIKYSIYDYNKAMVIEQKDYEKLSQVEIQKGKTLSSKERIDISDEKQAKSKNRLAFDAKAKEVSLVDPSILSQKIKYSLKGEEHQPTIIRLKVMSLVLFLLLVFNCSIWLYGFFDSFYQLKASFSYVEACLYMEYLQVKGVINVRSLVLLDDPSYTNYFYSRLKDKELVINETNEIYFSVHSIVRHLTYSDAHVSSEEHLLYIQNTTILCREIKDFALEMNTYNHTVLSAISQVNTALYHMTTENFTKISMNNIVYFYLQNSMNEIHLAQATLVQIYIKEFSNQAQRCLYSYLFLLIAFIPVYFLSFFGMAFVFNEVIKRKASYLTVFFEIRNQVILESLDKCEKFAKQIQTDNLNDFINAEEDESRSYTAVFKSSKSVGSANSLNASHAKDSKSIHSSSSKELLKVQIVIGIVLAFCFTICIMFYFLSDSFQLRMLKHVKSFANQAQMQLELIMMFNALREYLFDPKRYVNFMPSKDNFFNAIGPFFDEHITPKKNIVANSRFDYSADYALVFENIFYGNICAYLEFPPEVDCSSFLNSSPLYGLDIVSSAFFEELLAAKHRQLRFDESHQEENFKYNLSFTGSAYEKSLFPPDESKLPVYKKMHQIIIFNHVTEQTLMRTYWFILRPCYELLFNKYRESLYALFDRYRLILLCLGFGLTGLLILCYFLLWKPYEKGLNSMIFKTKNMLLIIPVNILATLHHIQALLGLTSVKKGSSS